ncbi:heavy metal translocating P-type ATPase [Ferrimonas lipolytica]|uniref:Cadmium-translocating P-type ATPase n=1 Tax=Ferrimonas lipolytica TaxID=2724191 RepID=A0A6H1UEE7_9GAMM|nr:heavy metal translocating P-type ATPase [Ferrimonas lipolytica]QIZ76586.1 cadmium-translocating P-type ATPase [Ferrimonas lipolytica]
MSQSCFHCAEPIPANTHFSSDINGTDEAMCCPGCAAVADAIMAAGLTDYYRYRTDAGQRQNVPAELATLAAYDLAEVQQEFVAQNGNFSEVLLSLDGISCAACAWLIEKHLHRIDGISRIDVNTTTQRAVLVWDNNLISLSQVLTEVATIGYRAAPFQLDQQEQENAKQSQTLLLRVGLAGLAAMQVMMLAVALYTGYFYDLEVEYRNYFRWVSLVFATPVVLYSAQPFYFSALRALFSLKVNMDVPVSLAIVLAYGASVAATVSGRGEVYFESVAMFTFFLLLGRLAEQRARRKASEHASNRQKLIPVTASIVTADGVMQVVAKSVQVSNTVRILPGESLPADGVISSGSTEINEAMLTGEERPVAKSIGDTVFAGTVNLGQPFDYQVTAIGAELRINTLVRLQEQAAIDKPAIAQRADEIAAYFVPALLVIAALTYGYWHFVKPADAFWITLSVLVATCPCALALATPAALTCGTNRMMKHGLLVRSARVLETLPKLTTLLFDKTGTLTYGKFSLQHTELLQSDVDQQRIVAIAAALESHSSHPYASAFAPFQTASVVANTNRNVIGQGLIGVVDGVEYRIGRASFADGTDDNYIYLANNSGALARFLVSDSIRNDAASTITELRLRKLNCQMLSGDPNPSSLTVANELNLDSAKHNCSPEQKLDYLKRCRQQGQTVAMFGDGINDGPVLAGADVSVAMGHGTDLAKCHADLILLGDKLQPIIDGIKVAKRTNRVIKQNLLLSLCYNSLIVPLAVSGLVAPYVAAAGMSLSSLVVLANSLRLLKD